MDKQKAFVLRKRGLSYNAIGRKLNVSKSTLSTWFSGLQWSKSLAKKLARKAFLEVYPQLIAMNKARALQWEKWREGARLEARINYKKLCRDPLFISGITIYWGEGDKNPKNPVRATNTDPRMLKIFTNFLRTKCNIPASKISAHMILYPDLNEKMCKKYWSSRVGIKDNFFNKTQFIKGRHKTKKLNFGICTVAVSSRQLKEKILEWIKCFSEDNLSAGIS